MAAGPGSRMGDLQHAILKVLWQAGPSTVSEVHKALADRDLAYTTVATLLRRMESRGLVRHREEGRKFVYEPLVSEEGVTTNAAGDVLDRFFEGRLASLFSHLLSSRDVSRKELEELERLIAARKKKR
jgi:BlaI family transcriptional regulator, penicillinase repressor